MTRVETTYATTNHDRDYAADELEFLRAIERYRRENHRPFPTLVEVLDVLRALGWRPVELPGPLPKFREGHP